jgi:hypothetical protein
VFGPPPSGSPIGTPAVPLPDLFVVEFHVASGWSQAPVFVTGNGEAWRRYEASIRLMGTAEIIERSTRFGAALRSAHPPPGAAAQAAAPAPAQAAQPPAAAAAPGAAADAAAVGAGAPVIDPKVMAAIETAVRNALAAAAITPMAPPPAAGTPAVASSATSAAAAAATPPAAASAAASATATASAAPAPALLKVPSYNADLAAALTAAALAPVSSSASLSSMAEGGDVKGGGGGLSSPLSTATLMPALASSPGGSAEAGSVMVDPEHLCCPLSLELMRDPVVAADGVTYERSCIEAYIAQQRSGLDHHKYNVVLSPCTSVPFAHFNLTPNDYIKREIAAYNEVKAKRAAAAAAAQPAPAPAAAPADKPTVIKLL